MSPAALGPPVGFAHRGASDRAPGNTLEAFEIALAIGSGGLESDVWLSSDGVPVLAHDARVGWRRARIAGLPRACLPGSLPSLAELYERCGAGFELSLDVRDPAAVGPVARAARAAGAPGRLWLCGGDPCLLAGWRSLACEARLVLSTTAAALETLAGRSAALPECVDVVNLPGRQWERGLVAAVHDQGRLALGWGVQRRSAMRRLLAMGIDGLYSDHADVLAGAIRRA
ncbi:MAG: glycerophosphodiester phosphodiesterase [Acidimicrobiales bacterium]